MVILHVALFTRHCWSPARASRVEYNKRAAPHLVFYDARRDSRGVRRICRTFCTNVQTIKHQHTPQRRRIEAQLPSIVYYGCMSFGAAAWPNWRCASAGAQVQHSTLWLSSRRAAPCRGPRDVSPRGEVRVCRTAPAALVHSARGCKRTRDQPPCHSSSGTYRAQLGARDRPRTSVAPMIAGAHKTAAKGGSVRRNACKRWHKQQRMLRWRDMSISRRAQSVAPR
jgi:hypothetical protein